MKMTRNVRMVRDVAAILKEAGTPVTHENVSGWVMSHYREPQNSKYGYIKQGDIAIYFREFHDALA